MSEYEPGTVAELTITDEKVRGFVIGDLWHIAGHSYYRSIAVDNDLLITDVRPLVVLDPQLSGVAEIEDLRPVGIRAYAGVVAAKGSFEAADLLRYIADQIEAQTRPPKPPEPQGLGAVVEDAKGERWVHRGRRYHEAWSWAGNETEWGGTACYADIAAVRVLSEGVQA